MTATWLTWRIHRFEILFVVAVAALLGVSAWIIADQIRGLGLTEAACWPRTEDGDYATAACSRMMEAYWGVEGQGALVRVGLTVAPGLLGLILGVPIVARELELRTAAFSWALTPSRFRWLLARFLPMLLVGVVALGIVAWAGTTLFDAMWLARRGPDLTEVAGQGIALVARGLAGIAVALLIGSLVGRTMPAFLIAVVVLGAWGLFAVPQAQNALARERSTWVQQDDDSWRDGFGSLTYVDYGRFDTTRPGLPGEPGLRVDYDLLWADTDIEIQAACGDQPDDATGESPEYTAWADCADPYYRATEARTGEWIKEVPRSAWGDFATLDIVMSAVLGGGALLLTWPVVARRRPG